MKIYLKPVLAPIFLSVIRRTTPTNRFYAARCHFLRRLAHWSGLFYMLAACVPVPVILGPRLRPEYLGKARIEAGATCQDSIPYVWIYGPRNVRLRVLAREDSAGRAVLVLSAVPFMGSRSKLRGIRVTSLASGKTEMVAPANIKVTGTLWIGEFPLREGIQSGYRVVLPAIDLRPTIWKPGVVVLRPVSARPSLPPLNC